MTEGQIKELICPECRKEKVFAYSDKGVFSSRCDKCRKIILWDFTNMTAKRVPALKRYNK